jgi:SAM-dependent methyltransferase
MHEKSLPDDPTLPAAERWDRRYRDKPDHYPSDGQPHPFLLERHADILATGAALDIACGLGRNAIWLAQRGLGVTAVDISAVACNALRQRAAALGLAIDVQRLDLEHDPLPPGPFDVIVNTLYLERPLAPQIERALAPGGLLLFSTMLAGGAGPEPVHKEYMLQRGELAQLFPGLELIHHREEPPGPDRPNAHLLARKPS